MPETVYGSRLLWNVRHPEIHLGRWFDLLRYERNAVKGAGKTLGAACIDGALPLTSSFPARSAFPDKECPGYFQTVLRGFSTAPRSDIQNRRNPSSCIPEGCLRHQKLPMQNIPQFVWAGKKAASLTDYETGAVEGTCLASRIHSLPEKTFSRFLYLEKPAFPNRDSKQRWAMVDAKSP